MVNGANPYDGYQPMTHVKALRGAPQSSATRAGVKEERHIMICLVECLEVNPAYQPSHAVSKSAHSA